MATTVIPYNNTPYDPSDESLLNSSIVSATFNPSINYIESTVSTPNQSFSFTEQQFSNYSFPDSGVTSNNISNIILDPESDVKNNGIDEGEYIIKYNFLKNELNSSFSNQIFFIKEISPDRTEVTLGYTSDPVETLSSVIGFRNQLNSNTNFFQDFFLNFGNDVLCVANNIAINNNTLDVLINLYEPLPSNINLKNTLWVVTQIANPLQFSVTITPEVTPFTVTTYPLQGPNLNIPILDQINNSTGFETYNTLLTSSLLSTSYSQLNNLISSSGIEINIDYTNFSNFVHFSSAVTRINNFYYKKQLIDKYQQEISILNNITSLATTGNTTLLTKQINNIIENFDGYEYFLYYGTGSWSYPKSGSTIPYTLYPAGSSEVLTWLGDAENLTGILGSASLYDRDNLDYLYNTVPNFIQEDNQNLPYQTFIDMVAQHYDNIWVYYKDVTNRYNTDNRLDYGISKDLVAEALKSFGVKLYQNNFSTNDLYSAFLGYGNPNPSTTNTLPVATGSGQEYIDNYITASYDASVMPLDDVNKEVYKRLYHNLPYLAKTKGTIPGLRALINCFGIPDTILRISEFGGRDKDTSTYDYFDQKYNYALNTSASGIFITTQFLLNGKWASYLRPKPDSIQFRFKPKEYISTSNSQSLMTIRNNNGDYVSSSLLILEYTGSGYTSSSYSGSTYSPLYAHANLVFYPKAGDLTISASIYQPFYNGDWWSVQLDRTIDTDDTFVLYAGSKGQYDGYDGNQVVHLASSSVSVNTDDTAWKAVFPDAAGFVDFGFTNEPIDLPNFIKYTGSLQEIRYWSKTGSVESFKDFIMNPHSIDYDGEENEYADYLAFRAPLGSELDNLIIGNNNMTSVHPKVTGSWVITSSFVAGSEYSINGSVITSSNIESYFYDQPIAGIKNRVTDKIQIVSSSYPTGSVLSQYRSLEQTYPSLGSETPDINLLEVAFSPQNEINNDIISSLGYFNIGEYIGDPRQASSPNYPDLEILSNNFFQKYFASYNLFDYIRLIKYFDNSLFKMLKDFVPARTSLASGVVIKQHLLERSKYPEPQVEWEDVTYSGSIKSQQVWSDSKLLLTQSLIETSLIETFSGGTGGTFSVYNVTGSILPNNTQSWLDPTKTPVGLINISQSDQKEFYNGELPYSEIVTTNGELNEANTFKYPSTYEIEYNPTLYISNITNETNFINPATSPDSGEIYLWWDSGSLTNPGNTTTVLNPPPLKTTTAQRFLLNRTNGVKYIKVNRYDINNVNQSDYLGQLETITLVYPDRTSPIIYNIAGTQEFNNYYLYSIGPYLPGSMNNFNTSSVGDIKNYTLTANSSSYTRSVVGNAFTPTTASLISSLDPLNYFNNTTHIYTLGNTPNIALKFEITASNVTCPGDVVGIGIYTNDNTISGSTLAVYYPQGYPYSLPGGIAAFNGQSVSSSTVVLNSSTSSSFVIGVNTQFIGSISISNLIFNVTSLTPEFNGSSSLTLFDPYVPNYDYNDYNAVMNNAIENQVSQFFMKVDYDQSPVIPSNLTIILDNSAPRAQVQDSNYDSRAYSNIRYNGSRTNSYRVITNQ
jgi:hypothetical protein